MIRLKDVHRVYDMGDVKVNALKGVDMHVKKGEFVSIMGPSGSGKSTLLHLIGVIDRQTKGDVLIKDVDVKSLSDDKRTEFRLREIGFVFQFYSLLPELTAIENTFLPNMIYGKKTEEYKKRGKELLEKMGLSQRLSHYPHQLSGGEQQRVSIARAIINKPEILLADEPTAALDTKTALNVVKILRDLNKEINQTVVLITHEESLGKMADRGIWLKDGLIEKEKSF